MGKLLLAIAFLVALISYGSQHRQDVAKATALVETQKVEVEEQKKKDKEWSYFEEEDEMGRGVSHFASVKSTNTANFNFPYAGDQHATLMLRNNVKGEDILFSIERGQLLCNISNGCTVLVRFDDGAPQQFPANEPSDHSTTILFIKDSFRFLDNLRSAKRVRISPNVYHEGSPVFEFDASTFDPSKYLPSTAKASAKAPPSPNEPAKEVAPKALRINAASFPRPSWCKKAKSMVEVMVCNDSDLSNSAIDLEQRWGGYKKTHTDDEIKQVRDTLRDWNKSTFQACGDKMCIAQAYGKVFQDVFITPQ